ncbi:hypothetical protein OJ252_1381 [Cryptosporidium canis]|uniref:Uncharacterized protein n=1 Tax=Cryptosporidium canis TaxID=195482 RepID=A0ABQ8P887_9CRYT|nr:hypothetical protein OJ252_1381 [Cryptosporidium canis]
MHPMDRDARKILYSPMIDLLRLIEVWSKRRAELQKSVQKYSALKIESAYISQKSCLGLNMFSLNENYISISNEVIQRKLCDLKDTAKEKMQAIHQILDGISEIHNKLSKFSEAHSGNVYSSINGSPTSGVSVDIVLDFLDEWKDCIESDIKIQGKMFDLVEKLKSHHTRNIQACLGYFQCSPYGDILEGKEVYATLKKSIREFITQ